MLPGGFSMSSVNRAMSELAAEDGGECTVSDPIRIRRTGRPLERPPERPGPNVHRRTVAAPIDKAAEPRRAQCSISHNQERAEGKTPSVPTLLTVVLLGLFCVQLIAGSFDKFIVSP